MKTDKPTRRERMAEQLKNEIIEAAIEVFKEFGYEKATTKKIAERAEVSEGTLYNYFNNKRDILISIFRLVIDGITNNLAAYSSDHKNDISKLLSTGLTNQLKHLHSLSIITLFLHEARLDPEVQKIFSEMIISARKSATNLFKQLEKEGKIRSVEHRKMAILMSIIGIGYSTLLETGDEELSVIPLEKITSDFSDILVNGLKV